MPLGCLIPEKDGADIDAVKDSILRERASHETSDGGE